MFVIASYLLGSIPTGLLLGKALGVDIRSIGSGNIGATNVYRALGRRVGVITLLGDCLKGLVPVLAARWLGLSDIWMAAAGLAAFLGHVYTVFLCFKGGKGVATALRFPWVLSYGCTYCAGSICSHSWQMALCISGLYFRRRLHASDHRRHRPPAAHYCHGSTDCDAGHLETSREYWQA